MKIVSFLFAALFLLGCSQESQEQTKESNLTQTNLPEKTIQATINTQEPQKEAPLENQSSIQNTQAEETKVTTQEKVVEETVVEEKKETLAVQEEAVKKVEKKVEKIAQKIDGAIVYKTCIACHGANAEKQALNKSQVIKGWESAKTVAALQGYKEGTYGGPMKAMMKSQVTKLSDAEIRAVADYISSL